MCETESHIGGVRVRSEGEKWDSGGCEGVRE